MNKDRKLVNAPEESGRLSRVLQDLSTSLRSFIDSPMEPGSSTTFSQIFSLRISDEEIPLRNGRKRAKYVENLCPSGTRV